MISISSMDSNIYIVGNNAEVVKQFENESINMIYFDPPYNTGRDFHHFSDRDDPDLFKSSMKTIVQECHRVLSKKGNIIVHIEPRVSHWFRAILDEVFGEGMFRNEIIWKTGGNAKNKYQLGRQHDVLLVYSKSKKSVFNSLYKEYDDAYKKKSNVKLCSIHKKEYVTTALHNSQPDVNPRPNLRYEWNGHEKQWYVTKEKMQHLHENNRLEYNAKGIPRVKRFLDEMEGVPVTDLWIDISNTQGNEKLDYATQKPIKLLERVLRLYSNEGDIVMDPFAGSGTLGRASLNLNRKYILIDINPHGKEVFQQSLPEI